MDYDLANELWLDSTLTQEEIAEKVGATPATFSRYVRATYSEGDRAERQARIRSMSQGVKRVPSPPWYTGPGRSVPLKTLMFCELHGITTLPPATSVVMLDGDNSNFHPANMTLMTAIEAKKWRATQR